MDGCSHAGDGTHLGGQKEMQQNVFVSQIEWKFTVNENGFFVVNDGSTSAGSGSPQLFTSFRTVALLSVDLDPGECADF